MLLRKLTLEMLSLRKRTPVILTLIYTVLPEYRFWQRAVIKTANEEIYAANDTCATIEWQAPTQQIADGMQAALEGNPSIVGQVKVIVVPKK